YYQLVLNPFSFFHYLSFLSFLYIFFFNDTATTEIYTLSLHDALPISHHATCPGRSQSLERALHEIVQRKKEELHTGHDHAEQFRDRKSTRLNSSHLVISYAVFCLKKKKKTKKKKKE